MSNRFSRRPTYVHTQNSSRQFLQNEFRKTKGSSKTSLSNIGDSSVPSSRRIKSQIRFKLRRKSTLKIKKSKSPKTNNKTLRMLSIKENTLSRATSLRNLKENPSRKSIRSNYPNPSIRSIEKISKNKTQKKRTKIGYITKLLNGNSKSKTLAEAINKHNLDSECKLSLLHKPTTNSPHQISREKTLKK